MDSDKTRLTTERLREADSLRTYAFVGISMSTILTLVSIVAVPGIYTYMQYVQMQLDDEVNYCRTQSRLLSSELQTTLNKNPILRHARETVFAKPHQVKQAIYVGQGEPRPRRQAYGSGAAPAYGPTSSAGVEQIEVTAAIEPIDSSTGGSCCSCGVGVAGPPGPPGPDGKNGNDGASGSDGENGPDSPAYPDQSELDFCFSCEEAPAGAPGSSGPKGPNGNPGANGQNGAPGNAGSAGPAGPQGPPGQNGAPGNAGAPGPAGAVSDVPGLPGPAGPPGPAGLEGPPGIAGTDGKFGEDGPPGPPGDAGANGSLGQAGLDGPAGELGQQGEAGGCSHCPTPRTAPGY